MENILVEQNMPAQSDTAVTGNSSGIYNRSFSPETISDILNTLVSYNLTIPYYLAELKDFASISSSEGSEILSDSVRKEKCNSLSIPVVIRKEFIMNLSRSVNDANVPEVDSVPSKKSVKCDILQKRRKRKKAKEQVHAGSKSSGKSTKRLKGLLNRTVQLDTDSSPDELRKKMKLSRIKENKTKKHFRRQPLVVSDSGFGFKDNDDVIAKIPGHCEVNNKDDSFCIDQYNFSSANVHNECMQTINHKTFQNEERCRKDSFSSQINPKATPSDNTILAVTNRFTVPREDEQMNDNSKIFANGNIASCTHRPFSPPDGTAFHMKRGDSSAKMLHNITMASTSDGNTASAIREVFHARVLNDTDGLKVIPLTHRDPIVVLERIRLPLQKTNDFQIGVDVLERKGDGMKANIAPKRKPSKKKRVIASLMNDMVQACVFDDIFYSDEEHSNFSKERGRQKKTVSVKADTCLPNAVSHSNIQNLFKTNNNFEGGDSLCHKKNSAACLININKRAISNTSPKCYSRHVENYTKGGSFCEKEDPCLSPFLLGSTSAKKGNCEGSSCKAKNNENGWKMKLEKRDSHTVSEDKALQKERIKEENFSATIVKSHSKKKNIVVKIAKSKDSTKRERQRKHIITQAGDRPSLCSPDKITHALIENDLQNINLESKRKS